MVTFITTVYVLVCLFLILVVLLQAGKGGGMGALSGGSSQTVFGGAGAGNFMTRLTMIVAALFMILSGTLAYLSSSGDRNLEQAAERLQAMEVEQGAGAKPADAAEAAEAAETPLAEQAVENGPGTQQLDVSGSAASDAIGDEAAGDEAAGDEAATDDGADATDAVDEALQAVDEALDADPANDNQAAPTEAP